MPRFRRPIIPGVPLHITQRGVDRCDTFRAPEDFAFYRWALLEASKSTDCAVHAYVLMSNHIHLLVTPAASCSSADMMRSLGRRYVRYFNERYGRTGTLWEGRYRSSVIDSTFYFLACSRYIELNPTRAGIVMTPDEYRWSSFAHNALGAADAIITPHELYLELGPGRLARQSAYRALFANDVDQETIATIRGAVRGRLRLAATTDQLIAQASAVQSHAVATN